MNILVTGGAGFIGSHLVDAYIAEGHQVTVLDNLSTGFKTNLSSQAHFIKADIRSHTAANLIAHGHFDLINHHAAQIRVATSVNQPVLDADINILGSLNLLQAASTAKKVPHFIFASSGGAIYGAGPTPFTEQQPPQPLSPYGLSKQVVELYLPYFAQQYNLKWTALRYANVYGPRQSYGSESGVVTIFLHQLLNRHPVTINGDGSQTRDFIYITDVVQANLLATRQRPPGIFNISTGQATSINHLFALCAQATNHPKSQAHHDQARAFEPVQSCLDSTKAFQTFGFKASIDLVMGLQSTLCPN